MKKITLLLSVLLFSITIFAQQNQGAAPLSAGQKQLNFGVGFSGYGIPAYVGIDFAIHDDITVGPVLKVILDDNIGFGLLGRGDYHFNRIMGIPNNWDFYGGASIGVRFHDNTDDHYHSNNDNHSHNNTNLDFNLHVGGRYYWSEKWAINLEFGGGNGYGTSLGVSMKL